MPKEPPRRSNALEPLLQSQTGESAAPSQADTAHYIAEMAAELSSLARHSKLDLLAYILDMARLEASQASRAGLKTLARR